MNVHTHAHLDEIPKSESHLRHQRQRFWQIIVPVGIGALVILVILALVIRTAVGTDAGGPVSQWADTSMIWMALPALLFALVMTLILIAMIYLLASLLKILPKYTSVVQYYAGLIARYTIAGADKLVAPIITIRGVSATISALLGALAGRRRH